MSPEEAAKLEAGDRVNWKGRADDLGTVTLVGRCAVSFIWDNGDVGTIHFNGCKNVGRPDGNGGS